MPQIKGKATSASALPAGTIITWAGTAESLPALQAAGWLKCDGSSVSLHKYPELFDAIGTTYGGNGAPNFNLPDLRGQFLRCVDDGKGVDPDSASRRNQSGSTVVGDTVGSFQTDQLRNHTHGVNYFANITYSGNDIAVLVPNFSGHITGQTTLNGGTVDGGGAESRPTNVYAYYLIASGQQS
jgi:microcystin-dependent protein